MSDDLGTNYRKKAQRIPLLTQQEELELANKWKDSQDPKALEKLIQAHMRLIAKVATGYRGYGIPVSDLIAEGHIGIMQAVNNFDPAKGFRFSTYAVWWIKASIQEYILKAWSLVKIGTTATQKKLFFNLRKSIDLKDNQHISVEEITRLAKHFDVEEREIIDMNQRLMGGDQSLHAPIKSSESEGSEWIDWLVDDQNSQEEILIHQDEFNKKIALVNEAMGCLSSREHHIFIHRRLKEPALTLDELSIHHGISRERVRQLEQISFEKLKKNIKNLQRAKKNPIYKIIIFWMNLWN